MNLSATLNTLRLLANPALCLPHHTIPTFTALPIPLTIPLPPAHNPNAKPPRQPDIRAVVLDKDNCFALPNTTSIHPPYAAHFARLRAAYPGARLLIVSNSAGTGSDAGHADAARLERETGVTVLRHGTKKPGCHGEIMEYFRARPESGVTEARQVAVVGDRLFTDVMTANLMGGWSIWVRDGVVEDFGLLSRVEKHLSTFLLRRGYVPPPPRSDFD
ncbi:hypothetical protein LTR08_002787 [Meristemomyces frigidus]|nr:hypothetical protein LTR08_002787 [Meristemomyces frigidus]